MTTMAAEVTYSALIEYASQQALAQEFTATQDRIVAWISRGWKGISVRTFQRHIDALRSEGKLRTRYTGRGIVYSLPDGVVTIPRISETLTAEPGVFILEEYSETQYGNTDPNWKPAEWSPAWGRFARFAPMGSDYASESAVERTFFHRNGEPASSCDGGLLGTASVAMPFPFIDATKSGIVSNNEMDLDALQATWDEATGGMIGRCPRCDDANMTDGTGFCSWCVDNPPAYFTGDDDDMTDADSPTARVAYLAQSETGA